MLKPCFILARKNSKGLKKKNIYKFDGLPLIAHTIKYAKKSKYVTNVVVSTDDIRIKKISEKYNCDVIYPRPKKFSDDRASSLAALKHAILEFEKKYSKINFFCYLQVTEPLRPKKILDQCFDYVLNNKYKSAFAGFTFHKNFWIDKDKKSYKSITPILETSKPRQLRKNIYRADFGVALVSNRNTVINKNSLIKKPFKIVPYQEYSGHLDIHNKKDILFGEMLKKLNNKIQKYKY